MSIVITNEAVQSKLQSLAPQLSIFLARWGELATSKDAETKKAAEVLADKVVQRRFRDPIAVAYRSETHDALAVYGDWFERGNGEGSLYAFFRSEVDLHQGYDVLRLRWVGDSYLELGDCLIRYSGRGEELALEPRSLNYLTITSITDVVNVKKYNEESSSLPISYLTNRIDRMAAGLATMQGIMDELTSAATAA